MQVLSAAEYERLTDGAEILARDDYGIKVLRQSNGTIFKLFRLKRKLSSAVLWPYALRFERASKQLAALKIPTVEVSGVYKIPSIKRHVVIYRELPGAMLRSVLAANDNSNKYIARLAAFISTLHERGVYFRGIHLGNIVVLENDNMGLIDVSEARVKSRKLGACLRARNFRPLVSYEEDRVALSKHGICRFINEYLAYAKLSSISRKMFLAKLGSIHGIYKKACLEILDNKSAVTDGELEI